MSLRKTASAKMIEVMNAKDIPPASILLLSRTVVEKKDFVSTGLLNYAEGDMIEIEISDYHKFELGDAVRLTIYSPAGIYNFPSTIIAKDEGMLIVINPPENRKKFVEKREHPRIDIKQSGLLKDIVKVPGGAASDALSEPVLFQINNISMSGVGFTVPAGFELKKSMKVELEMDLGGKIACVAEIVRSEQGEDGNFYGALLVELPTEKKGTLRAFILKSQVESLSNRRKEEKKRMFKI